MNAQTEHMLADALAQTGEQTPIKSCISMGGDATQRVWRISLHDGRKLIAKAAPETHAKRVLTEAAGLQALAQSGHLLVPDAHDPVNSDAHTVLIMQHLGQASQPPTNDDWARFGRELASHHQTEPPKQIGTHQYGWDRDNYLGATPQPNNLCDDWVEFNAVHRLGYQLRLAREHGQLSKHDCGAIQRVIDRLNEFIPHRPHPALLHGDLWSGNAIITQVAGNTRIAVIDPAPHYGDAWADIAMMRLFGGFPDACLRAYAEVINDNDRIEQRTLVYQLYHTLNHLNLFGASYRDSALRIARRLVE